MIYLATPYSKYPTGIQSAFEHAADLAGRLLREGIVVYSPIVHSHPISVHGGIDPLDHDIWLPFDEVMMRAAESLLVAKMWGWEDSFGIAHEIEVFRKAGKPIRYLDPKTMEITSGRTAADIAGAGTDARGLQDQCGGQPISEISTQDAIPAAMG